MTMVMNQQHTPRTSPSDQIRLIAVDIDGTLLNSRLEVTPRTMAALQAVRDQGRYLIPVTGRSFSAVKPLYDRIGANGPAVCFNGAGVADRNGNFLHEIALEQSYSRKVIEVCRKRDFHVHMFLDDQLVYERVRPEIQAYEAQVGLKGQIVDFDRISLVKALKVLCIADHAELEDLSRELDQYLEGRVYKTFSLPHYLEVMNRKVSKAVGLKAVCGILNIEPSQIAAFGDGDNDIDMLAYAGLGVAMGNASPRAQAAADVVAMTNDEDGLARFLEDFFDLPKYE